MSLLRSDSMGYYNIIIPRESAWEVLNQLGQTQVISLIDQNSAEGTLSRPFTQAIKRADEVSTHLTSIYLEMVKYKKEITKCTNIPLFLQNLDIFLNNRGKAPHTFINDVEQQIAENYSRINDQTQTLESLQNTFYNLVEYRAVLRKTKDILGDQMNFA